MSSRTGLFDHLVEPSISLDDEISLSPGAATAPATPPGALGYGFLSDMPKLRTGVFDDLLAGYAGERSDLPRDPQGQGAIPGMLDGVPPGDGSGSGTGIFDDLFIAPKQMSGSSPTSDDPPAGTTRLPNTDFPFEMVTDPVTGKRQLVGVPPEWKVPPTHQGQTKGYAVPSTVVEGEAPLDISAEDGSAFREPERKASQGTPLDEPHGKVPEAPPPEAPPDTQKSAPKEVSPISPAIAQVESPAARDYLPKLSDRIPLDREALFLPRKMPIDGRYYPVEDLWMNPLREAAPVRESDATAQNHAALTNPYLSPGSQAGVARDLAERTPRRTEAASSLPPLPLETQEWNDEHRMLWSLLPASEKRAFGVARQVQAQARADELRRGRESLERAIKHPNGDSGLEFVGESLRGTFTPILKGVSKLSSDTIGTVAAIQQMAGGDPTYGTEAFGHGIGDYWDESIPEATRGTLPDQIGQTAGSLLATLPFGMGVKAITGAGARLAVPATSAALGASMSGGEAYLEARKMGLSDEQAMARFAVNAGLGTVQALGVGRVLARLDRFTKGGVSRFLLETSKVGLEQGGVGAVQSAGRDLADLLILEPGDPRKKELDQILADATREGVYNATIGLLSGGILGGAQRNTYQKGTIHRRDARPSFDEIRKRLEIERENLRGKIVDPERLRKAIRLSAIFGEPFVRKLESISDHVVADKFVDAFGGLSGEALLELRSSGRLEEALDGAYKLFLHSKLESNSITRALNNLEIFSSGYTQTDLLVDAGKVLDFNPKVIGFDSLLKKIRDNEDKGGKGYLFELRVARFLCEQGETVLELCPRITGTDLRTATNLWQVKFQASTLHSFMRKSYGELAAGAAIASSRGLGFKIAVGGVNKVDSVNIIKLKADKILVRYFPNF